MHLEVRQNQDVVILDLKGKLTAGFGDQLLREAIDELLAEDKKHVVINLSEVAFLDSAGLGELVAGLRTALIEERRGDLVRQITRKMLSYALGRRLEYYDEATVRQIIQQVESDDRRLQTLIQAIVACDAFQSKQVNFGVR